MGFVVLRCFLCARYLYNAKMLIYMRFKFKDGLYYYGDVIIFVTFGVGDLWDMGFLGFSRIGICRFRPSELLSLC